MAEVKPHSECEEEPHSRYHGSRISLAHCLPQETCDNVIDNLQNDVDALRTCSLVCRDWASSTARHLFSNLHWPLCIHSLNSYLVRNRQPAGQGCPHTSPDGHGLAALLALLTPRLSKNIRNLHFGFPTAPVIELYSSRRSTPRSPYPEAIQPCATLPELLAFMDALPRLHSLELASVSLKPHDSPSHSTTTVCCTRSLATLTINECTSVQFRGRPTFQFSVGTTCQFLRHFTRITTLRFEHIKTLIQDDGPPHMHPEVPASDDSARTPPLRVETLVLSQCSLQAVSAILSALQNELDVSGLTTLVLEGYHLDHSRFQPAADPVLAAALPALLRRATRLAVLFCEPCFYPHLHPVPATLRALHVLGGHAVDADGWPAGMAPSQWPGMLRAAPPAPHLRTLSVNLCFADIPPPGLRLRQPVHRAFPTIESGTRQMLARCDWAPLARAAARVERCTLRLLVLFRGAYHSDASARRRLVDAVEESARRRMPEGVRDKVRIEVVDFSCSVAWEVALLGTVNAVKIVHV